MALTLAEADKYSTNEVLIGVAETSIDSNPLLGLMPFTPVRGNAVQYQRENAASAPTFIAAGGTVIEGTPTTTLITLALKILIGDADVDKFLAVTRSKDQDLVAELLAMKARNFADTWGDAAIYGSIDAAADQFDGLHEIIGDDATAQQIHASADATSDPGAFSELDQMIDLVRPQATHLLMSRRSRRGIQTLASSQGRELALDRVAGINRPLLFYHDLPIIICDFIGDVETISAGGVFSSKTGGDSSSIFAVRLDTEGLFGVSAEDPNAPDMLSNIIQLETVGTLETKDANRYRLKHYGAIALKATQAIARYDGVGPAAWVN